MKNSSINISYTCPVCLKESEIKYYPLIPAKTYGPPENCYPEEGREIDPEDCPNCGQIIDFAAIEEAACDKEVDYREDEDIQDLHREDY